MKNTNLAKIRFIEARPACLEGLAEASVERGKGDFEFAADLNDGGRQRLHKNIERLILTPSAICQFPQFYFVQLFKPNVCESVFVFGRSKMGIL